jgi:hypothetical protein
MRCLQAALPSGAASVPFASGVMALAGVLAAEPRVTLEVWHKERCAGSASAAHRQYTVRVQAGRKRCAGTA